MIRRRPPDPLPRFYRWRTNILQAPLFFLYTGICGSLSLFVSLWDKEGSLQHRIARTWARGCVKISGAHLTVRGAENLRKHPVAVYASNHTSYMDTPVVFSTLPFQFRILAKKELWTMPFIGWHLNRSGQIPVDTVSIARLSPASARRGSPPSAPVCRSSSSLKVPAHRMEPRSLFLPVRPSSPSAPRFHSCRLP